MPHPTRLASFSRLFTVALVVVLAVPALSIAGKWQVRKGTAPIYYKLQVSNFMRRGVKPVILEVDIQATEQKDAQGEPMFKVRTTQEMVRSGREIQGDTIASGAMSSAWSAGEDYMLYQPSLSKLDLVVGEELSFFNGHMLAKVEGQAEIAGYNGFVVKVYLTPKKGEPALKAEVVLHPDVPMALRARSYDRKGKLTIEKLLLKIDLR